MSDYSAASSFCLMLLASWRTRREHPLASDNRPRPQNHLNKKTSEGTFGWHTIDKFCPEREACSRGERSFWFFKRALPHPHHPLSRNSGSDIMRWSLISSPNQHATFAFTSPPASPAPRGFRVLWSHRENWLRQLRHCKFSDLSGFSALINLLEVESRLSTLW